MQNIDRYKIMENDQKCFKIILCMVYDVLNEDLQLQSCNTLYVYAMLNGILIIEIRENINKISQKFRNIQELDHLYTLVKNCYLQGVNDNVKYV